MGFHEVTWRKLACFHICLAAAETLLEFDCRSFIANSLSDHTGSSERHTPTVRLELSSTKSFPMLRTCESVKWGDDAEGELKTPEPPSRDQQDLDRKLPSAFDEKQNKLQLSGSDPSEIHKTLRADFWCWCLQKTTSPADGTHSCRALHWIYVQLNTRKLHLHQELQTPFINSISVFAACHINWSLDTSWSQHFKSLNIYDIYPQSVPWSVWLNRFTVNTCMKYLSTYSLAVKVLHVLRDRFIFLVLAPI